MYNSTEHLLYKGFLEKADGRDLYLPLEIDTEYTHPATIEHPRLPICTTITVQCQGIWQSDGIAVEAKVRTFFSAPDSLFPSS